MGRPLKERPRDKLCLKCKDAMPIYMFKENKSVNPDGICNKCLRIEKRKSYASANPKKTACDAILKIALKSGHLVKRNCEFCGESEGVDGHHPDYDYPLDVMWLCRNHHAREHARLAKLSTKNDG